MAPRTEPTYAWVGVAVDLLLILVGLWLISRGANVLGEILVAICTVGLVVSGVQVWRARRAP